MNRTQKAALSNLFVSIFALIILPLRSAGPPSLVFKERPLVLFLVLILCISCIFRINRKQKSQEVHEDERDKLIQSRAALAGFLSVLITLISLVVATGAAQYYLETSAAIPVGVITLFCILLSFLFLLIYSMAILIQYGWEGKHGNSPEGQK